MIDIIDLLKMSSKAVLSYTADFLAELGGPVYQDGENFVFAPGNGGHVLFQAHVDTVRSIHESPTLEKWKEKKIARGKKIPKFADETAATETAFVIIRKNGIIRTDGSSPLGADDRAGVWIALNLAEKGYPVLLTNYEETGGHGMDVFIESALNKGYPMDAFRLFVGLDRKEYRQFVSYGVESDAVNEWVSKKTNYKKEKGTFSDVKRLSDTFKYPNVNLAAGFYHEHSPDEYLVEGAMVETFSTCLEIAKAEGMPTDKLPEYKIPEFSGGYSGYNEMDLFTDSEHDCGICGSFLSGECDPRFQRICDGVNDLSVGKEPFDASWVQCTDCQAKDECIRLGRPVCMEYTSGERDCDTCPAFDTCLELNERLCEREELLPGTRSKTCFMCVQFEDCVRNLTPQCDEPQESQNNNNLNNGPDAQIDELPF